MPPPTPPGGGRQRPRLGRALRTTLALAAALALAPGCAHDRILPVVSRCGDGRVTAGEECDVDAAGCTACRVDHGWECDARTCQPICGDGELAGDEDCDPPDGVRCDASCHAASVAGCDATGYWIVRQVNFSRDTIVGQLQTSSNWYFYHFTQQGSSFETDEALHCGLEVTGSVHVTLGDSGLRSLLYLSDQDGKGSRPARRGTYAERADGCALSYERWYLVRGVDPSLLPADFSANPELSSLPPLPTVADPLHPDGTIPAGVTDPDGDGLPGLALYLSGNLSGVRNVGQLDWDEYVTPADAHIPIGSIEFTAESRFDNDEEVYAVTDCPPAACGLLVSGSTPARDLPGQVVFRYLGQTLDDPRVAAIAQGKPGEDRDVDMATCALVREAMPHVPVESP